MSTLSVNNIIEKTTGAGVQIPGHVVQTQIQHYDLSAGTISSSSMVDLPNVYVDITPKHANNIIIFHTNFHAAVTGTNSYARFRVVDANNSDTVWSSNSYCGATGYKVIDSWLEVLIRTSNPAGTTNTMRLQLQAQVTADNLEWAWSGGDRRITTATEIAV